MAGSPSSLKEFILMDESDQTHLDIKFNTCTRDDKICQVISYR